MKKHAPIHPGEVLREDFLVPLGLSEYRLANDIGVPRRRINEIVKGKRSITADTALRLSRYFAWPAEVWLRICKSAMTAKSQKPKGAPCWHASSRVCWRREWPNAV